MLNTLSYRRVFTATKPLLEELIIKFYTSFEFHDSYVLFQFIGIL